MNPPEIELPETSCIRGSALFWGTTGELSRMRFLFSSLISLFCLRASLWFSVMFLLAGLMAFSGVDVQPTKSLVGTGLICLLLASVGMVMFLFFVSATVSQAIRRLNSIGQSRKWVWLYAIPVLNLALFITLVIVPANFQRKDKLDSASTSQ